jgi:hypothetical protein
MNKISAYQNIKYEKCGDEYPFNTTELAPVAVFVYNRPLHTLKTLDALRNNTLAAESALYIFSDGIKQSDDDFDREKIVETRRIIKSEQWCKSVHIFESQKNEGLAASIIDGVTQVLQRHGKIIVLEDDLVTSKYFLQYMNDALRVYQNKKEVWHIAGYSYPCNKQGFEETFFTKHLACWGWGTWDDRWIYFKKNTDELLRIFNKKMKYIFNYGRSNEFFGQLEANKSGKINTWAVFWYAAIFTHNGYCLNPRDSFVANIGMDGSGIHCGKTNAYDVILSDKYPVKFEMNICELAKTRKSYQKYFQEKGKIQIYIDNVRKRVKRHGLIEAIKYYMAKYIIQKPITPPPP